MPTLATLPMLLLGRIPIRHIPILPPCIRNNSRTPTRPPPAPPQIPIPSGTAPRATTTPQIQLAITLHKRPVQDLGHAQALPGADVELPRENVVEIRTAEFRGTLPRVAVKDGEIPAVGAGGVEIVEEGVGVLHRATTLAVYVFGDADGKGAVCKGRARASGIRPVTRFPCAIIGVGVGRRRRRSAAGGRWRDRV